eukprot:TRINITY_DN70391_c0_g1_i1.p1 TRINITY_DN70391_c0_g1~~TRINITY_DN70391_c0_g1_i1.p1  ORF type:complete len:793 (+),score=233.95 TRINITY_DN70391_c0_g1_i1:103-2379(+)
MADAAEAAGGGALSPESAASLAEAAATGGYLPPVSIPSDGEDRANGVPAAHAPGSSGTQQRPELSRTPGAAQDFTPQQEAGSAAWQRRRPRRSQSFLRPRPQLQHPDLWQHFPLLCRCGPGLPVLTDCDSRCIPLNPRAPVHFETPLFRGRMYLAVRNCPRAHTDPWAPGARFAPKRRKTVLTVQGNFKERLRMDTVQTGWEWAQALRNLPWGIGNAERLIRVLGGPGSTSDLCSKTRPFLFNLLCCGADAMHVWDPQADPPEQQFDITAGICPERSHWPDVKARQQALGAGRQAAKHYFETAPTYTFDFYGDKIDLPEFVVNIPVLGKFGLTPYLGPQPLPFLARTLQGDYLWNFEVWHAQALPLLPPAAIAEVSEEEAILSVHSDTTSFLSAEHWGAESVERRSTYQTCFPDGRPEDARCAGGTDFPRRRKLGRVRIGTLRDRWAAWDVTGHDGRNPRPGDALCAGLASGSFIGLTGLACFWWRDTIADRVRSAVNRVPSWRDWLVTLFILLGLVCIVLPLGTFTDWWRWGDKGQGRWLVLACFAAAVLSVLEEIVFRVALIPLTARESQFTNQEVVMFFALSLTTFVTHYGLLAATCVRIGYPTFFDPRFQALVAVLGGGCGAAYLYTQSLWPPVALHAICMISWLAVGGGARRLRRVRFSAAVVPPIKGDSEGTAGHEQVSGIFLDAAPVVPSARRPSSGGSAGYTRPRPNTPRPQPRLGHSPGTIEQAVSLCDDRTETETSPTSAAAPLLPAV